MNKDLEQLISMGMTLPQGALGILQSLHDMGGTFEDYTSLIGDRFQCDEIARSILRRHIITVDCTIRPIYPDSADPEWINSSDFITLESTGPSEFDVRSLDPWIHGKQKKGSVAGKIVYEYLKSNNMLPGCLGLRDLEEIQKKGIAFFRSHFKGQAVFGMKSVVRYVDGRLRAPCLIGIDGEVVLVWGWLDDDWGSGDPALRFAS